MLIRTLSIVSVMTVTALCAFPLLADDDDEAHTPAYRYGMRLDIARVIRIDEPAPPTCEIVRAKMTYVNSQGATEQVSFLKQAEACLHQ